MDQAKVVSELIHEIAATPYALERRPEPRAITDNQGSVSDYDRVLSTNMTVNYAASLDIIYRARQQSPSEAFGSALDLCSGPGHVSRLLATHLHYQKVLGVDFSQPMVDMARKNARSSKSEAQVDFQHGDVLRLEQTITGRYDLVSFTNAAHHLDSLEEVRGVLASAEKFCKDDGVIVLTDLCRLNNEKLTKRFVELAGDDYRQQKMNWMYEDFLASMFAAWSMEELKTAIPYKTDRTWYHLVMGHLPFFQALIALPKGREELFVRSSFAWETSGLFRSESARQGWGNLRGLIYSGTQNCVAAPERRAKKAS